MLGGCSECEAAKLELESLVKVYIHNSPMRIQRHPFPNDLKQLDLSSFEKLYSEQLAMLHKKMVRVEANQAPDVAFMYYDLGEGIRTEMVTDIMYRQSMDFCDAVPPTTGSVGIVFCRKARRQQVTDMQFNVQGFTNMMNELQKSDKRMYAKLPRVDWTEVIFYHNQTGLSDKEYPKWPCEEAAKSMATNTFQNRLQSSAEPTTVYYFQDVSLVDESKELVELMGALNAVVSDVAPSVARYNASPAVRFVAKTVLLRGLDFIHWDPTLVIHEPGLLVLFYRARSDRSRGEDWDAFDAWMEHQNKELAASPLFKCLAIAWCDPFGQFDQDKHIVPDDKRAELADKYNIVQICTVEYTLESGLRMVDGKNTRNNLKSARAILESFAALPLMTSVPA